jgi:catechol 2,3-dioxygenase-like lactoylglutathione lyase family enzyme
VRVKRVGYVGVRTPEVDATTSFFRDVLGLEDAGDHDGMTFTRLPTNRRDFVEVYPPDMADTRMIPTGVDFMIGLVVDDLEEALAAVRTAGLEQIGDIVWADEAFENPEYARFGWFFVRAPDGHVYAIEQLPD